MSKPNYLIIGERRSGTTTLANYLTDHPEVFVHPRPDIGYFIDESIRGRMNWLDGEPDEKAWEQAHSLEQYAELFATEQGHKAIGEKSADYLFWRPAHQRISSFLPNAKLIAILRDPAERAWSHYWNEVGKGRENLSFGDALKAEPDRIAKSAYARDHLSYKTRGYYHQSIGDILQLFQRDQLLVICLEQLIKEPIPTLQRVYQFLEVDPSRGLGLAGERFNINWTMIQRSWIKVPLIGRAEEFVFKTANKVLRKLTKDKDRTRHIQQVVFWPSRKPQAKLEKPVLLLRQLREEYQESIDHLEDLLGQDFSWLRGPRRGNS